jgi:hypothetical protein
MKEKMELLIANINDDLESIQKLKKEYDFFIETFEENEPDIYQRVVVGFYLHNFYSACENIFLNIAKTFENNIEPETWHKSILKRMKLEIEGIRPRVISESLYKVLDDFRSFRHVFRHVYSFELDWEKERIVAGKFEQAISEIQKEMAEFISFLRTIIK